MIQVWKLGNVGKISPKHSQYQWDNIQILYYGPWGGFYFPPPRLSSLAVKLINDLCIAPWLRRSGAIPLLPLYDLISKAGTDFT